MPTTVRGAEAKQDPRRRGRARTEARPRLSRLHRSEGMSLETWQTELRRRFGREQRLALENIGTHPVFSEFRVTNPVTKNSYRVAIRGAALGDNFCSCPDFATNTLGTCKHVEFTLARIENRRGGKAALRRGFRPTYSEVHLHYGARREVRFRAGTECPATLVRLVARYFDRAGVLRPTAFGHFERFLAGAGHLDHELRCYEDALGFIAEVRDTARRREVLAKAFPRDAASPAFESLLRIPLYPYQRDGALFAARAGRCLLGDEMGLGKTIQAIAAVEIMARHLGVERVLIVCPTSLKHQWEREIARCTDRSVEVIGGLLAERTARFATGGFFKITNYDTVHRDLAAIHAWSPDVVILDEAQRIKNWATRTARSVKQIASRHAIVLTGTPLENRLQELVSIVEFVDQHRLGPTFRFLDEHQLLDEHGRVIGYRDLDRIGKTLAPILIRRRKAEVLQQLPKRLEKHFFVAMTPEQMAHHAENREIVARLVHKWRRHHFLSEADQRRLMIALQNMRMACDSTYLLDGMTDFGVKADELATLLEEIFEQPDVKVVIFSQWLRMHELLVRRFTVRGWPHVVFHGGLDGRARKGLIDRFREDPRCRAFLSTDAGGVGLNLQHAAVVVNMDLPWNPAVLEQRIGRVHRLGQTRPVRVVNFVAEGTIEHGMLSLLGFKRSLFAGVLDGGEKEVFLGGSRLGRFMESVEKATAPIAEPKQQACSSVPAVERAVSRGKAPGAGRVDPLASLLRSGLAFLEQLAASSRAPSEGIRGLVGVMRDERSGQAYLTLPMPDADVVDRVLRAVGAALEGLASIAVVEPTAGPIPPLSRG